jgi:hypothetical protein
MWFAAELFGAIESSDNGRIWRLLRSLNEQDAVTASTNLGPNRLRNLLYQFVRQSRVDPFQSSLSTIFAPAPSAVASLFVVSAPEVLVPVVLAQAYKDRSFLPSNPDANLATRVQRHITQLHARRKAQSLFTLYRDVTRTLQAPVGCPAPLSESQYVDAAKRLDVEVAAIKAVAKVESGGRIAFDNQYRATILFEAHQFRKYSKRQYDLTHPHLSCTDDLASDYYSWDQYNRLYEALVLDPVAAVQACSWGKFQVMGFNHNGWPDPISFARAMQMSETNQLKAFEEYCKTRGTIPHLKKKEWAKFAELYNGTNYKKYKYDTKMEAAYKSYVGK